ncbi:MAG: hypothetical protein AAGF75_06340 [Cyanobacteria bacterium P01_H01_bin.130]
MLMGRLVLLLAALVGVLIVVFQNLSTVLPLVVLGQPLVALPLGVWIGGAIAIGVLGNGLLRVLGAGSQRSRREPELRAARPGARRGSSRRQVVESLAEEIWEEEPGAPIRDGAEAAPAGSEDEWSVGGAGAEDAAAERGRSPRRRVREEEAPEGELEEVIGGWSEPNRSRQGWDYEPEWDEDEAWVRPGTGRRPPRSRQQPPVSSDSSPVAGGDRVGESRPGESRRQEGSRAERMERAERTERADGRDSEPAPQLKNFEKAGRPVEERQSGSVYSYRYREDGSVEEEGAGAEDARAGEASAPSPAPSSASPSAPPSAPSPAPRPIITPPPVDMPPRASSADGGPSRPPITLGERKPGEKAGGSESAKRENSRRAPDYGESEEVLASPSGRSQSRRGDRKPLNLPPESEAPSQPKRKSVMDAEYRVLRPPDDDWEDFGDEEGDGDWDDW